MASARIRKVRAGTPVFAASSLSVAGPSARLANKRISFATKRNFDAMNPPATSKIGSRNTSDMKLNQTFRKAPAHVA
jgi:hypothetical protein